jgi:hypothetical protein
VERSKIVFETEKRTKKKWGKWIRRNQLKVEIKRKDQIGSKLVMQWEEKNKGEV